jgi:hypothetical protein
MRLEAKNKTALDVLDSVLQCAQEPTVDLLAKTIRTACTRIPLLAKPETFDRPIEFAKIGAWTDAALVLIALELPRWRVRRLVYENGEWLCSLSHQPNLPMAFDDCAEATHEILSLAMLRAFVDACRRGCAMPEAVSIVPHIQQSPEQIMCCENYR